MMLSHSNLSVLTHTPKATLPKYHFSVLPFIAQLDHLPETKSLKLRVGATEPWSHSLILPIGLILVVFFLISVTADGDDAHRRAGSIWNDDWLMLIWDRD